MTKLQEQGLLSAETIHQSGRPDKKLYSITEDGKNYLRDWIAQPSDITPLKNELLVKLFAGHLVSKPTIMSELQHHRTQHLERLSEYKDIEQRYFQNPHALPPKEQFPYLTLRMGIRYETEWLAWCDEVIEFLN